MSWHRFGKNAVVNSCRAARRTTPLRVERLEGRAQPSAPVPAEIVSWYRAEGDASDFVGDNDGTLLNGATFTAGKVGQAFLLDGVDDLISIPDDPSLEPGSNFTIEAWVNPSSSGHGRPIAEKRAGNGNAYTFETTHAPYGPNDGLQFVVYIGGVQQNFLQTPAGVLHNNTWQHVAATYNGTALRIFVDGDLQAESSVSGAIDDVDAPSVIGLNSVAAFAWAGAIDELSLYSRALTQSEIRSIFDAGSEGKGAWDAAADFSIAQNPNGPLELWLEPNVGRCIHKGCQHSFG